MNNLAFKQFLDDYDLSIRKFCRIFRGVYVSKSTVARLIHPDNAAEISPSFLSQLVPTLIKGCQSYLEGLELPAEDIHRTLRTIFEEDYQPMICERYKLDPEQLEFFGLDRDPFAASTDPKNADEVLTTRELDRIVRIVETAVNHQDFVCVLGEVGCGKTTLKNRIADRLRKQSKVHLIFPKFVEMGKLNAPGIVHYMLEHFGQRGRMRLPLAQVQLEKHLQNLTDNGHRVSLFIDEIHRISGPTLTALKNFLEMGTGGYERFLSVVGFGQLRFKTEKLENVEFREIAERIQILKMPSMEKHAADYVAHRIGLAGGNADKLFAADAIKIIASQASTPLAIGNLANKALIEAYKKGETKVQARFLEKDTEPRVRVLKKVANA